MNLPAVLRWNEELGRRFLHARTTDWLRLEACGGCDALRMAWRQAKAPRGLGGCTVACAQPLCRALGSRGWAA